MSQVRRERLMEIQKREQLKGMLINKFKLKYGNKANLNKFIDNEVTRFLANDRLTEGNLKSLDAKISKEADNRDRKDAILDDRRSQRSHSSQVSRVQSLRSRGGLSAADLNKLDKVNEKTSQADARSIRSKSKPGPMSVTSSKRAPPTEVFSEINENEEWAAIQKFNTLLHFEEQKQMMLREAERKRLMREELAKQLQEKSQRHANEDKENKLYDEMAEEHGRLLEKREQEKQSSYKAKLMEDKKSRDIQLVEEKRRRRQEEKNQMSQEQEYINRLSQEMENERQMLAEKRR